MLTHTLLLHYSRVLNYLFCFCKIANFTIVAQIKHVPVLLSKCMAIAGHCHTAFCLFYQSRSQIKSCLPTNIKNIFKLFCLLGDSRYKCATTVASSSLRYIVQAKTTNYRVQQSCGW